MYAIFYLLFRSRKAVSPLQVIIYLRQPSTSRPPAVELHQAACSCRACKYFIVLYTRTALICLFRRSLTLIHQRQRPKYQLRGRSSLYAMPMTLLPVDRHRLAFAIPFGPSHSLFLSILTVGLVAMGLTRTFSPVASVLSAALLFLRLLVPEIALLQCTPYYFLT